MKNYLVKIEGITPYMQHRMDTKKIEEWEKSRGRIIDNPDIDKSDLTVAEFHCYKNSKGKCFIPSEHIRGALINAGALIKAKVGNSSKSLKNIVAGMFFINPFEIEIPDFDTIDKRTAVNRNIKARITIIRPLWTKWSAEFTLQVDNDTIGIQTIKDLFMYAGNNIGIGSFRPTNNGMFGRFKLVDIDIL